MSLLLLDNWNQIRLEFNSKRILRINETVTLYQIKRALWKKLCDGSRRFLPPQQGAWGPEEAPKFFCCTKIYRVIFKTNSNIHTWKIRFGPVKIPVELDETNHAEVSQEPQKIFWCTRVHRVIFKKYSKFRV